MVCSGEDAIVGKTVRINMETQEINSATARFEKRDKSKFLKANDNGIVDRVMISTNDRGFRFVKVLARREATGERTDARAQN